MDNKKQPFDIEEEYQKLYYKFIDEFFLERARLVLNKLLAMRQSKEIKDGRETRETVELFKQQVTTLQQSVDFLRGEIIRRKKYAFTTISGLPIPEDITKKLYEACPKFARNPAILEMLSKEKDNDTGTYTKRKF